MTSLPYYCIPGLAEIKTYAQKMQDAQVTKSLQSWLSFVVSTMSLSHSHWYPGSGVILDCIDS